MQIVVPVKKNTPMHKRFKSHQDRAQPINYHASGSGRPRCKHRIDHCKDGLPGFENFYLTVLGF